MKTIGHRACSTAEDHCSSLLGPWIGKQYHVLRICEHSFPRLCDFQVQYRMHGAKLRNHLKQPLNILYTFSNLNNFNNDVYKIQVPPWLSKVSGSNFVVGGELTVGLESRHEKGSIQWRLPKYCKQIKLLISEWDLMNFMRNRKPKKILCIWIQNSETYIKTGFFLVEKPLLQFVMSAVVKE